MDSAPSFDFAGGRLLRHAPYPTGLIAPRPVDIWLPPGYAFNTEQRWPVVYMHDGQNLFDATVAFTGVDWGVDEAIASLMQAGKIQGAIVVGVWNTEYRYQEYAPQGPFEAALSGPDAAKFLAYAEEKKGAPFSDNYLRFLVSELKPFIDATFRTQPDPAHTVVMGSSMGGLISLYALEQYPHVFGRAGCLSTHWPAAQGAFLEPLAEALPAPLVGRRLYFDFGTRTLDATYEPYQRSFDEVLRKKGYRAGVDWVTRKFSGAMHDEAAWRARVKIPLEFLLA
jgi:predicted alpha/beta superfamily hydrolase